MIEIGSDIWAAASKWILALLIVIFGWLKLDNTNLKSRMGKLEVKHSELELKVAENYVTKEDLQATEDRIVTHLTDIKDRLK